MSTTEFADLAEKTIESIAESIETADNDYMLDVDMVENNLHIELPSGDMFVVSIHNPSEQIWLSSPMSGGSHFSLEPDNQDWVDNDGNELFEMLAQELYALTTLEVEF